MFKAVSLLSFSILLLSLMAQGIIIEKFDDTKSHLDKYAHCNQTHHDNIADAEHSHTHKHSEDGEEHEHHHEHNSSFQSSSKLFTTTSFQFMSLAIATQEENFNYKSMISSEHPFSVFRPPVV